MKSVKSVVDLEVCLVLKIKTDSDYSCDTHKS